MKGMATLMNDDMIRKVDDPFGLGCSTLRFCSWSRCYSMCRLALLSSQISYFTRILLYISCSICLSICVGLYNPAIIDYMPMICVGAPSIIISYGLVQLPFNCRFRPENMYDRFKNTCHSNRQGYGLLVQQHERSKTFNVGCYIS
jgi:hypothetical protein